MNAKASDQASLASARPDADADAGGGAGVGAGSWDAVVIGAGPAGSAAAIELARAGARTLLVDRAAFPRDKVCGGCLTRAALALLDELGLGTAARERGLPLREVELHVAGRSVTAHMPGGVSLSRWWLDAALVERARELGVVWAPAVSARVDQAARGSGDEPQAVELTGRDGAVVRADARAVIVADGLGGRSLGDGGPFAWRVARRSHIGLGARLMSVGGEGGEVAGDLERFMAGLPAGRLRMAVGRRGYVGLVRLEDGSIDLAAAVSPGAVRAAGGPAGAVRVILDEAGAPGLGAGWSEARLTGTPALTRRRGCVASGRVFVVGDAAGYVEPFTGEGVTWALAGGAACGQALAPWLGEAGLAAGGDDEAAKRAVKAWRHRHRAMLGRHQRRCRSVTMALRRPWLLSGFVGVMNWRPSVADRLAGWIHTGLGGRPGPSPEEIA